MKWLREALVNADSYHSMDIQSSNSSSLTCPTLNYEERFSIYGDIMT